MWRDSEELRAWNVFAVVVALSLGLLSLRGVRLGAASAVQYVLEGALASLRGALGPILLVGRDLSAGEAPQGISRRVRPWAVGLILTVPVVVLFGALLGSADPVFERLVRVVVDLDIEQLLSHVVVIGVLSWLAAGYLRSVVVRGSERGRTVTVPSPGWGAIEVGVPLGALAVLFLAFVVIQARYLFGGEDLIRATVGLTYAEYARRGFFELVAVAGLVLPLLLAAELALRPDDGRAARIFRALAATVLVLVACIIASAGYRLRLYHAAYGWTQDRFYAAAIMVWIAAALAWFGVTVLRGQGQRFMLGAAVAGFAVIAGLNVVSPDAVIARTNLARAEQGAELDAEYLSRLSADAAGVLDGSLSGLAVADRCAIARRLDTRAQQRRDDDWRSWNLGRSRADHAHQDALAALSGCPAPVEETVEGAS